MSRKEKSHSCLLVVPGIVCLLVLAKLDGAGITWAQALAPMLIIPMFYAIMMLTRHL